MSAPLGVKTRLSSDLEMLVRENYLLTQEALAVQRLPKELQEKAIDLSEAQRGPLMEKIVSELLNPTQPVSSKPLTRSEKVIGSLIGLFILTFLFGWPLQRAASGFWHWGRTVWSQFFLGLAVPGNVMLEEEAGRGWRLKWEGVGEGYRYQMHFRDLGTPRDVKYERPALETISKWNPYPAVKREYTITASDPAGRESAPSKPILIGPPGER